MLWATNTRAQIIIGHAVNVIDILALRLLIYIVHFPRPDRSNVIPPRVIFAGEACDGKDYAGTVKVMVGGVEKTVFERTLWDKRVNVCFQGKAW